jgi:hypothetical protein
MRVGEGEAGRFAVRGDIVGTRAVERGGGRDAGGEGVGGFTGERLGGRSHLPAFEFEIEHEFAGEHVLTLGAGADQAEELFQFAGLDRVGLGLDQLKAAEHAVERSHELVRPIRADLGAAGGEDFLNPLAERLLAADAGVDGIEDIALRKRFGDVVGGAERHAATLIHARGVGGEKNERHIAAVRDLLHGADDFKPIHRR